MAHKSEVLLPYSKVNLAISKILAEEGYIQSVKQQAEGDKKSLIALLKYDARKGALSDVKIISTPSLHIYAKKKLIPKAYGKHGMTIVSTNKGIMTDKKAWKEGLGGKVICQVF